MPEELSPMTVNDKDRLWLTLESHTRILDEQTKIQKEQTRILNIQSSQLNKLDLGMFGDEKIKFDGVVKDVAVMKIWISGFKMKIAWIAGLFMGVGFSLEKLWDWITRK